jgi:hypothetical protein
MIWAGIVPAGTSSGMPFLKGTVQNRFILILIPLFVAWRFDGKPLNAVMIIINVIDSNHALQGLKLDRQIRVFQHKIQQALVVKDDKIERMTKQLILCKTEIAES